MCAQANGSLIKAEILLLYTPEPISETRCSKYPELSSLLPGARINPESEQHYPYSRRCSG